MRNRIRTATLLTALAAATGASAETIVTFQQGVGGYLGTFDRRIGLGGANANGADVDTDINSFFIDGDPFDADRNDYLIRFDDIFSGSGIPLGATILDAQLSLTTTSTAVNGNSQSSESYNVYRLTQGFSSTSTLDGDFGDGDGDFTDQVDGVEPEQNEADWLVGTFDHPIGDGSRAVDLTYSATVTRAVQGWANGDANLGLAVVSDHNDNDDGWSVHTTGSATTSVRPKLTVTYSTDPALQVTELQQELNNYNGTTDIFLRQEGATVRGQDVSEEFLDGDDGDPGGSNDNPYMLKFDISGVQGEVERAELIITTGFSSSASDAAGTATYAVHQLLTEFNEFSLYSEFAGDRDDLLAANEIAAQAAAFTDMDEAEQVAVDVTSIVENWLNGDTNHGFYIGSTGTENGWQIFSSGAIDPDLAPMLRIYTVPEPSSLALLAFAGLGMMTRRRR